jgi:hypothetical protein
MTAAVDAGADSAHAAAKMDGPALARALAAAKARPLLVDPRLVRRVIKRHRRLPGFGLQVPHARCYALPRAALLDVVRADEIGPAARDLPEDVILLPRPDPDEITGTPAAELLEQLWRYAFHAQVHVEIERRARDGRLTTARLKERIHRIGQTEFDEIRLVLRQDDLLLPPHEDLETYAEFAALYLELSHFAPALLAEVFPTLEDHEPVLAAIAEDVDAAEVLAATRPEGAPAKPKGAPARAGSTPPAAAVPAPAVAEEAPPGTLRGEADDARRRGNVVRSALNRLRLAADGGPDAEAQRADARADLAALARRLDAAVRAPDAHGGIDVAAWEGVLHALAARVATPRVGLFRWVEARLLYDVQRACLASERAIGKVDLVDWILSLGKRPLARMLPATSPIRAARELASAAKKVKSVGLDEADRARLAALLADAHRRADEKIRAALRPAVLDALREVGLSPKNVPERIALDKLVEELLDHATARGFLNLSLLRDALARNRLKLGDLAGPRELFGGDALLRADQRLALALDGVHRRGEVYLRVLQKLSSLLFGTGPGRLLTQYLILPIGAPFVALKGTELMLTEIGHLLHLIPHHHHPFNFAAPIPLAVSAVLSFGLLHSAGVRTAALVLARGVGFAFLAVFLHAPRWVLKQPLVRAILDSGAVLALRRYVLKPGLVTAAAVLGTPLRQRPLGTTLAAAAGVFVLTQLVLNSRTGAMIEEIALDALARTWRRLRRHVLPGLFRMIVDFFRWITNLVDRGIYAVDEWLRFREGQSRAKLAAKAALGVVWFGIAYVVRIYVNLLIEPTFNPVKHFPWVTVAAKLLLPFMRSMRDAVFFALVGPLGHFLANLLTGMTVPFASGVFGFLAWEFKENYKLYDATRAAKLKPVPIGHHGETMSALLKPGLHSGTVPKLWAKLRRAAKKGDASVEKYEAQMREIEEAVERFVDREMVALLCASAAWKAGPVHIARVEVASNRIRVAIGRGHGAHGRRPTPEELKRCAVVSFEEQSGWLVAGIARKGFVDDLSPGDRAVLENALAGLYALSGVDMVRQQIEATLEGAPPYDVSDEGLVVWPKGFAAEVVYDLDARGDLRARTRGDLPGGTPAPLPRARIMFGEQPIAWADWVAAWSEDEAREEPPRVVKGPTLLGCPASPAPKK